MKKLTVLTVNSQSSEKEEENINTTYISRSTTFNLNVIISDLICDS